MKGSLVLLAFTMLGVALHDALHHIGWDWIIVGVLMMVGGWAKQTSAGRWMP